MAEAGCVEPSEYPHPPNPENDRLRDISRLSVKTITCLSRIPVSNKAMEIGYARVSTGDQHLDLQERALREAGVARIFTDRVSGSSASRPGLDKARAALSSGDVLVIWRLDRLGRSLPHLISVVADLGSRGVGLRSLSDAIDTTTAQGKLIFHMMGALAEFERGLISERTQAGLQAAKARGARLGRRPALDAAQVEHARKLIGAGERPTDVARSLKVGRATLYRALRAVGA